MLAVLVWPMSAHADDVADEADHLFTLGAERYQDKDYKGALQYFLASNRLVRNRNVIFNIARTYEHLRDFPDAYRYYQRALEGEEDAAAKTRIKESMARIAPSVALLRVETEPPGATIYLNRKDLGDRGTAPQTIALPPGTYSVIAELKGYEEATSAKTEVRIGAEKTVTLKLARVIGTLRVADTAQARGAEIRIDADDASVLCTVPCDVPSPPGQHVLILTKPGFKVTRQNVQVRANAVTDVKPELEPETGSLVVNADERDAVIEVDGQTKGFTPAVLTVPVGKHVVRVTLRGFRPVEQRADVEANKETKLDLTLFTADAVEAASRISEPVEDAPASVTLIPSPELRAMRYPTVAEAVRGTRGVFVSDDRGYKSLGFRGFGRPGDYGNRVLVLLDGHPMNDNWLWSSYVGYDLRTDIEDIDRIEVVRGPGSVLFGTGAFSGVVNLVTNARDVPEGREVGVSVVEDGVARARVRYTKRFSSDSGVTTSVMGGRSAGRDLFTPEYVNDGPPSVAGNARGVDGMRVATWTGRVWWKWLTAQWSANTHDKNLPAGQFETLYGDSRTKQADTRLFLEAKAEPKIGDTFTSMTRAHGNYYSFRGRFAGTPEQGGMERNPYDGAWAGAEQRLVYTPVKLVRATAGGEGQYHFLARQRTSNEVLGNYFDDKHTFTLFAGYGMVDLVPSNAIKISAAARFDAYSTFGSSLNPRLAVILKPYEGGNVKIIGGKAFRAPSIYELFYRSFDQIPNPDLKAENLYSAEVEYSHRFSRTVVGLASVYANHITGLIALRDISTPGSPLATQYSNANVPVGILGGEVELRREWKEGWMVGANYAYQKAQYLASGSLGDFLTLRQANGLRDVPNAPNHLASIRGGVPLLARALMLMSRLTFEGPRPDRNDVDAPGEPAQRETAPAVLWDLVFSGGEPRWGLSWSVGVYNAFDWQWRAPVSAEFRQSTIPQLGRSFLASAAVVF